MSHASKVATISDIYFSLSPGGTQVTAQFTQVCKFLEEKNLYVSIFIFKRNKCEPIFANSSNLTYLT
jgi:hypothetical protein